MRMHMQEFMYLKALYILIFIQQIMISSYHASYNCQTLFQPTQCMDTDSYSCAKSQNCPP